MVCLKKNIIKAIWIWKNNFIPNVQQPRKPWNRYLLNNKIGLGVYKLGIRQKQHYLLFTSQPHKLHANERFTKNNFESNIPLCCAKSKLV